MATSRSNLPKEMLPPSSTPKRMPFAPKANTGTFKDEKRPPFAKAPVEPTGNPFTKKAPMPKFAAGGTVGSGKEATPGALPVAGTEVKPTGAGIARGTGAATKGKKFSGTY